MLLLKVLLINGNIEPYIPIKQLMDKFGDLFGEKSVKCDRIELSDFEIKTCRYCSNCLIKGDCIINDDFIQLKSLIAEADAVIIGSQCFGGEPSQLLKAFFDRLYLLCLKRSCFENKYFVGVSVGEKGNVKKVAKYCAKLGRLKFTSNGITAGIYYKKVFENNKIISFIDEKKLREIVGRLIRFTCKKQVPLYYTIKTFFSKNILLFLHRIIYRTYSKNYQNIP